MSDFLQFRATSGQGGPMPPPDESAVGWFVAFLWAVERDNPRLMRIARRRLRRLGYSVDYLGTGREGGRP